VGVRDPCLSPARSIVHISIEIGEIVLQLFTCGPESKQLFHIAAGEREGEASVSHGADLAGPGIEAGCGVAGPE
jgi:hypothetical protein